MNAEQRVAFLMSQVACFYAKLEAMKSRDRADRNGLHHTPEEYEKLADEFQLGHNTVVSFLLEYR